MATHFSLILYRIFKLRRREVIVKTSVFAKSRSVSLMQRKDSRLQATVHSSVKFKGIFIDKRGKVGEPERAVSFSGWERRVLSEANRKVKS